MAGAHIPVVHAQIWPRQIDGATPVSDVTGGDGPLLHRSLAARSSCSVPLHDSGPGLGAEGEPRGRRLLASKRTGIGTGHGPC